MFINNEPALYALQNSFYHTLSWNTAILPSYVALLPFPAPPEFIDNNSEHSTSTRSTRSNMQPNRSYAAAARNNNNNNNFTRPGLQHRDSNTTIDSTRTFDDNKSNTTEKTISSQQDQMTEMEDNLGTIQSTIDDHQTMLNRHNTRLRELEATTEQLRTINQTNARIEQLSNEVHQLQVAHTIMNQTIDTEITKTNELSNIIHHHQRRITNMEAQIQHNNHIQHISPATTNNTTTRPSTTTTGPNKITYSTERRQSTRLTVRHHQQHTTTISSTLPTNKTTPITTTTPIPNDTTTTKNNHTHSNSATIKIDRTETQVDKAAADIIQHTDATPPPATGPPHTHQIIRTSTTTLTTT